MGGLFRSVGFLFFHCAIGIEVFDVSKPKTEERKDTK